MGIVIHIPRHVLSAGELLARFTLKIIGEIGHILPYRLCCLGSLATCGRIGGLLKGFVRIGHLILLIAGSGNMRNRVQERD